MKKRNQGTDLFKSAQHGQFVPMIPSTNLSRQRVSRTASGTTPAFDNGPQRTPEPFPPKSQYRPGPGSKPPFARTSIR